MIFRAFPNLEWLRKQANSGFADRKAADGTRLAADGWPNVVMNATAKGVCRDNIRGPLSIFTNLSGTSSVTVDRRKVEIPPDAFFVTNAGQHYSLEIDRLRPTETLNIHFGEHFAAATLQSMSATAEDSLDNKDTSLITEFHNRLLPSSQQFVTTLQRLKATNDRLLEEELLVDLLHMLVSEQKEVRKAQERIGAVKSSTREEIMKRLVVVTDFLYSHPERTPDLEELARVSCLSRFHFLRLFKLAFRLTPHQFLLRIKVDRAKGLLMGSGEEVGAIAERLGFDSASSFSRLFHQRTGLYPSQFRANLAA